MKYALIPLFAALAFANQAGAQGKSKGKATPTATSTVPAMVAPAPAGPINMKEIEGKWKVERVDIDTKPVEGEASKTSEAGSDEDFFDFTKGTLTSYLTGASQSVVYSVSGHYIISRSEGITDSLLVTGLNKTQCIMHRKESTDEGVTNTTIVLKR